MNGKTIDDEFHLSNYDQDIRRRKFLSLVGCMICHLVNKSLLKEIRCSGQLIYGETFRSMFALT
jgi:hypothetical protein